MSRPGLIFLVLFSLCISSSYAQSCRNYNFASNQIFSSCNDLPVLNSFLHWTYNQSTRTARIAYRHAGVSSSRWVAWAINPTGRTMAGSQALVAYQRSDGSMRAYTSPVSGYQTQLQQGDLSFPVSGPNATFQGNEIIIFATLDLSGMSSTTVNQVWQEGPVSGDSPTIHQTSGPNVQSMATLNLLSGETGSAGGGTNSRIRKRNIHGVLNAVSWGVLLPIGFIFARYLKVFPSADPAWFYLHAACQTSGYIIGVAGWATGLRLGSQSVGIEYKSHRIIGIVIFCLATLQVTALLLRPKKDHKYRLYWNIYHHVFGYSVIVLSIVNIFKGFDILDPAEKWKRAYVGILIGLAVVIAFLEVYTWIVVVKRKRADGDSNQKTSNGVHGSNGHNNGYGFRPQDRV